MGGHVVASFKGVLIIGLVFGDKVVENGRQVTTHIGVGIFVDTKATTGVLYEEVEQSDSR